MTVPATLIRISTQEVIKRGTLPTTPDQPVPGLDPDFEWLIDYIPYNSPEYDPRIYSLITTMANTDIPHPTWALYNQFLITYTTEKRNQEELKAAVDQKEQDVLNALISYDVKDKLITDMIGILIALSESLNLDDDETAVLAEMEAKYVSRKIHKNRKKKLYDDIEKDKPFDIDDGWV